MRLILVRHGQTPSNVLGLLDTAPPGPGLTDLGIVQAAQVPVVLRDEPIGAVLASTARRAQQTAAPLAADRGLAVQVRDGLREVAAGDWEMAGDDETIRRYLWTIGRWMVGELDLRTPGATGESGAEVLARFDAVVAGFDAVVGDANSGATVMFAHGAVIRFWASLRSDNLGRGFGAQHPLVNTGIVVLDGSMSGGWRAVSWTNADLDRDYFAADEIGPAGEDIPVQSADRD